MRDRSDLRSVISAGNQIAEMGYKTKGRNSKEVLDEAERIVFEIAEKRNNANEGPQRIDDILLKTLARMDSLSKNRHNGGVTGVSTGFVDLNKKTAGLQPSDLIIVAARPSMGKTTFAMNLCENASLVDIEDKDDLDEQGNPKKKPAKPVLIFSLEMPADQIMMRMLASLSRVDQTKIRTGQISDDEDTAKISSTMAILQERNNIYIDDSSGLTPTELRSRARRIYRENGGLSLIMVDYLQLMRAPGFADNRTLEIAEISRSLKALAKELEVPVVALSQLNRSLEQRADKRPVNSDLRESGSIEQDADLIMFIYRDEVYNDNSDLKGIAEIIIGKQRNGPIGRVRLTFQGQYSRLIITQEGIMMMNTKPTQPITLCAIYRSKAKEGMYLYVPKRDQFEQVPETLRQLFGKPEFVMMFNLTGEKPLVRAKNEEVLQLLIEQGYYLQMPPPPENLHKAFIAQQKGEK